MPITDDSDGRAEAGPPTEGSSEGHAESSDARLGANVTTSEAAANSTGLRPPSSPMMDLETDFPSGQTSFTLKSICSVSVCLCS